MTDAGYASLLAQRCVGCIPRCGIAQMSRRACYLGLALARRTGATATERPPMATMLIARETPPRGGDTVFANMYLAYETLSDGMKRMLDGLVIVNSSAKADVTKTREDRVRDSANTAARQEYAAEYPAVRTHPETGHKALYANGGHALRFRDMSVEDTFPTARFPPLEAFGRRPSACAAPSIIGPASETLHRLDKTHIEHNTPAVALIADMRTWISDAQGQKPS